MKIREVIHREDAAGVGIITKQNTTQDVKPGETERNLKKLHLINSINEKIDWQALRKAGVVMPMAYHVPSNPVKPDARQPNIITAVNLTQKLGPGEKLTPFTDTEVTPQFWQQYMDSWWIDNKNDPAAKDKINQITQSAKMKSVVFNENFADGKGPGRKGDSKRAGIPKSASIAQLKKIRSSKTASARKKQLAHWQINMRQGRKK